MNILFKKIKMISTILVIGYSAGSFAIQNYNSEYRGTGSITQGEAKRIKANLFECNNGRSRIAGVGEVQDARGYVWTVPAINNFTTANKATDLYNECAGITPSNISELNVDDVPVISVDPSGEVITGYLFADNYFELYINGKLIGVDAVPFTPFNSSIVKFRVNKPYTIAVKLIDWEENLGLGSESNRGSQYHPGDGGFIASFSDGTVTNAQWQAQTFYTAPIYDLGCLSEVQGARLSTGCSGKKMEKGENAYAIHWQIPNNWMVESFNSMNWPQATVYSERVIGVNNKRAYMNFREKFAGGEAVFIWSSNVVLDNEILLRYTVKY